MTDAQTEGDHTAAPGDGIDFYPRFKKLTEELRRETKQTLVLALSHALVTSAYSQWRVFGRDFEAQITGDVKAVHEWRAHARHDNRTRRIANLLARLEAGPQPKRRRRRRRKVK